MVTALVDARSHRIPNSHTAALAVVAVAGIGGTAMIAGRAFPATSFLAGATACAAPWLTAHLISPANIGFGDVKLAAGLGLYLGPLDWRLAIIAIAVASVAFLAGSWVVSLLATGGAQAEISQSAAEEAGDGEAGGNSRLLPFGPALVAGAVIAAAIGLL